MLTNILLIIFQIFTISTLSFSQSSLLTIDPLSIYVDPMLHHLCWNYLGNFKDNHIMGINDKSEEISFETFQNIHKSNKTYCIKHREISKRFQIKLPFSRRNNEFVLNVSFSMPLGPKLDVIRLKAVPRGIYFQLNNEFGGISTSELVKCNVTMISQDFGNEKVHQFTITAGTEIVFQKLSERSSMIAFSSCIIVDIIQVSTSFIKYEKPATFSETTVDLNPHIPLPLKRFLMVAWRHPKNIPSIYYIVIYEKFQPGKEICIKMFRLKNLQKSMWKSIVGECSSKITIYDLGYYNGKDKYIYAILDLITPLNIYSNYKLSIYWENELGNIRENFLYFTPLPNDNSGVINSMFLNYMKFNYEDVRSNISSLKQNLISANEINPVEDKIINDSGYQNFLILPSISENKELRYKEINKNNKPEFIEECKNMKECSKRFYPYFYLVLLANTKNKDSYVEIVQIALPIQNDLKIVDINLYANNEDLTFTVSWKITNDGINPGIYGVKLIDSQSRYCEAYYILKCSTCHDKYKEISQSKLPMFPECKSVIYVKENQFTADSKYFTMNTNKIPDSNIFKAKVFGVVFSSVFNSSLSNENFIRDSSWKKNSTIAIVCVCFVICIIIAVVIAVFVYRHRTHVKLKLVKEVPIEVKCSNDSLYDEDVDETHFQKTYNEENENQYEES